MLFLNKLNTKIEKKIINSKIKINLSKNFNLININNSIDKNFFFQFKLLRIKKNLIKYIFPINFKNKEFFNVKFYIQNLNNNFICINSNIKFYKFNNKIIKNKLFIFNNLTILDNLKVFFKLNLIFYFFNLLILFFL